MPKKKVQTVTTEVQEIPETPETPQAEPEEITPDQEELFQFFQNIGSSSNLVKIYKLVDGVRAWCGQSEPSAVSEESIYRKWGGGRYIVVALNNGRYIPGGQKTFTIYDPPLDSLKPVQSTAGASPDASGEIAVLRESLNRQHEMILKMMEQHAGSSRGEIVELLDMLNHMQPKQPDISALLPNVLDLFKSTMEMAKENSGTTDSKLEMFKMISDSVQKILPALFAGFSAKKNGGTMPTPESVLTHEQQADLMLHQAITVLKDKAAKNKSVATIVDYIADNMDDQANRALAVIILNKSFDDICKVDPEIGQEPFRTWFLNLYNELKAVFSENPNAITGETGSASSSE